MPIHFVSSGSTKMSSPDLHLLQSPCRTQTWAGKICDTNQVCRLNSRDEIRQLHNEFRRRNTAVAVPVGHAGFGGEGLNVASEDYNELGVSVVTHSKLAQ